MEALQAVGQPAGLGISLLRPRLHPRPSASLSRPENIVHFFRDIHQIKTISKEVLRQRTNDYQRWVEAFAKKRKLPLKWAERAVRKDDYVRPYLYRQPLTVSAPRSFGGSSITAPGW